MSSAVPYAPAGLHLLCHQLCHKPLQALLFCVISCAICLCRTSSFKSPAVPGALFLEAASFFRAAFTCTRSLAHRHKSPATAAGSRTYRTAGHGPGHRTQMHTWTDSVSPGLRVGLIEILSDYFVRLKVIISFVLDRVQGGCRVFSISRVCSSWQVSCAGGFVVVVAAVVDDDVAELCKKYI